MVRLHFWLGAWTKLDLKVACAIIAVIGLLVAGIGIVGDGGGMGLRHRASKTYVRVPFHGLCGSVRVTGVTDVTV